MTSQPNDGVAIEISASPTASSSSLADTSRSRRASRLAASILASPEEHDQLTSKAEADLRSHGIAELAESDSLRMEEEDIVTGHIIKARERPPPDVSLSRRPSPMVMGVALTVPLHAQHSSARLSASASAPASDQPGASRAESSIVGHMPAVGGFEADASDIHGLDDGADSGDSSSTGGSPFASPCSSPRVVEAMGARAQADISAAVREDSHARVEKPRTESLQEIGRCNLLKGAVDDRGLEDPTPARHSSGASRQDSDREATVQPHTSRPSFLNLSGLSSGAGRHGGPSDSVATTTYEHLQFETAMSRAVALANRRLSFFERLERIRRGQSTTMRSSTTGRSTSPNSTDRRSAQDHSVTAHLEEPSLSGEVNTKVIGVKFDLPKRQLTGARIPNGQVLQHSGTVRAKQQQAAADAKLGQFERESSRYESFQFEDEESKLHLEFRASATEYDRLLLLVISVLLIILIGILLGCISATITLTEARIWSLKIRAIDAAMWPCEKSLDGCQENEQPQVGAAFATFLGMNLFLIFGATVLTHFAPRAALSGLPPLKAYLNGTRVPGLLHPRTLVSKVIGTTLVVATGLPLGREGPMVHVGACVAAGLSRLRLGPMPRLLLGIPSKQRVWVGMGAAAGIAAAFNAPLGGILYSFEEVCSHWSAKLTWRSFFCVTIAAYVFNLILRLYDNSTDVLASGDEGDIALVTDTLLTESFVIGLNFEESHTYGYADFGWFTIIGILGGLLGAAYTTLVVFGTRLRRRFLGQRPRGRMIDALFWSAIVFCIFFWAPFLFRCRPCPDGTDCGHAYTTNYVASTSHNLSHVGAATSASHRALEEVEESLWVFGGPTVSRRRRLAGSGGGLVFVQHGCHAHQYNELATLLLSPQEGLIKHLLQRESHKEYVSVGAAAAMLGIYFLVSVLVFGISVPSGNFVPAMTLGAAMGRFMGDILPGLDEADIGRFALMGAGAVLCGVTRMTITLVAILVEVTHDVGALLPLMYTLAVAKISADLLAPSFDDGMMRVMRLPYLEEDPPHEFELLTARDVMSDNVVVLREVERVGDVFAVLKRTRHSGFAVVDVGQCNDCTFFSGLILRRHLLVLLKKRIWEYQAQGLAEPAAARLAFVSSARSDVVDEPSDLASLKFTDEEKMALLDLRPYMDPCPYLANELMPLRRVYRLFGDIGVRHLPVVDCREQVVGIITRKDVQPEIIEERVIARERERVRQAYECARNDLYKTDPAHAAAIDFGGGWQPPRAPTPGGARTRSANAARGLLSKAGVLKPVPESNDEGIPPPSLADRRISERKSTADVLHILAADSLAARGVEKVPPQAIKARRMLSNSLERLPQIKPIAALSSSYDSLSKSTCANPCDAISAPSSSIGARRRTVADVVTTSKDDGEPYSVLHVTRRSGVRQEPIPVLSSPVSIPIGLTRHGHSHHHETDQPHHHGTYPEHEHHESLRAVGGQAILEQGHAGHSHCGLSCSAHEHNHTEHQHDHCDHEHNHTPHDHSHSAH